VPPAPPESLWWARRGGAGEDWPARSAHAHYHCERNQQGLDNRLIAAPAHDNADPARPIARRERLGGLLSDYYRAVA